MSNKTLLMNYKFLLFPSLLTLIALGSYGCFSSLKGNPFTPIIDIPKDKAIVYIYRPDINRPTNHTIKANGEKITIMQGGSYYPFIATPGFYEFSSVPRFKFLVTGLLDTIETSEIALNIEANQVYFIKTGHPEDMVSGDSVSSMVIQGIAHLSRSHALILSPVDNETGTREIQGTVLLEPY